MKSIVIALFLVFPLAANAYLYSDDPRVNILYTFGGVSEPISPGECNDVDECYDYGSNLCYYDDGYSGNVEDCESMCGEVFNGATAVVDSDNRPNLIGCGCLMRTTNEWRPSGTGRERKYNVVSGCGKTGDETATNEYRCAAGYYGVGTTSSLNCTRCPGELNSAGTTTYGTSAAGSTSVTQCKLPAGTYNDNTGTYNMSAQCTYN